MKKIAQFLFLEMVVMFIHADTIIGPPYISGPGCSKLGQDNPGLVRNLNSNMRAYKANSA